MVQLAKASNLDVILSLSAVEQSVSVEADASILTTSSSDVSGDLNGRAMENLPLTTRNTFNPALFAPGFNGRRDDEFGNPTFAFGGMQRREFLIDGIDSQRGGPGRRGVVDLVIDKAEKGGLLVTSADNNFDDRNVTWASQWTRILSASTVNEFRFGSLEREFFRPLVSGKLAPVISISGVAQLGSDTSANQYCLEHQYDFVMRSPNTMAAGTFRCSST